MKPLFAVAFVSLLDFARRKSSILFLLAVAASAVVLPRTAPDVGHLRSRLQVATSYGIGFPFFLIATATVLSGAGAVARDVASRRIQTVATKPCRSWQIVAGKLLAIVVADAALLLVVLAAFALNARSFLAERGLSQDEKEAAFDLFFTPRLGWPPLVPPVDEEAIRSYVGSLSADAGPGERLDRRALESRARRFLEHIRVPPGEEGRLRFQGVPPQSPKTSPHGDEEGARKPGGRSHAQLVLTYTLRASPPGGSPQADCIWELRRGEEGGETGSVLFQTAERVSLDVPHEVLLPGGVLPPSGEFSVAIRNPAGPEDGRTLIVSPREVEILLPYGRFWPGALRSFALLLGQLALLAAMTILAGSIFTMPTACVLGLFLYVTGIASGFLRETFALEVLTAPRTFFERLAAPISRIGTRLLELLPDVGGLQVIDRLTHGRALPAGQWIEQMAWVLIVGVGIPLVVASLVLTRRELAGGPPE